MKTPSPLVDRFDWLRVLRRYLIGLAALNLMWEVLQLPLYTLWSEGSAERIAFAVLHCTAGDLIVATVALAAGLLIAGNAAWPSDRYWSVAGVAIVIGFLYTSYSEWVNVHVRGTWAYSPLMPVLPGIRIGLSPLLQWSLLPALVFVWAGRR